ncbi:E3 ubiquitin-protein ligase WAV3 [Malania oleifera]|uniref:E3 ubiquitin-protein ligase WAV3 n=1 Tax=Malania oleifera TaxID=397392 RepID=UPI0025ADA3B5|nr:E3 ubiquitin-protein ligase WAV3 [Malania oleifera]
MVGGWRRAFCTSISRDRNQEATVVTEKSPRFGTKFGFFSNPSTPRLQTLPVSSPTLRCRTTVASAASAAAAPPAHSESSSPKLQCKLPNNNTAATAKSPRLVSNPSSPRSPSTFSLLKSTLRLSKNRCGICLQSVKTGQGTAIFTAECSHAFHFPCIAAHVTKHSALVCPVCSSNWKEVPLLAVHKYQNPPIDQHKKSRDSTARDLKIYDDDEPLTSPTCGARFNPIPESDENDEDYGGNQEFQGFFVNTPPPKKNEADEQTIDAKNVVVKLSPEAAVVSVGRSYETYAVVLKVRAPPAPATSSLLNPARRAPIDLVTVLDVSGSMTGAKLQMLKRAMRLVISSLCSSDRLSIVAFSGSSKRLLPLRRMTIAGRRSARRVVDGLVTSQGTSVSDALKKAAKVLEDRRERNPVASIMLLSDGRDDRASNNSAHRSRSSTAASSTRFAHVEIPVHAFGFGVSGAWGHEPAEDSFAKCVGGLLSVVVQDIRVQLGFVSGSAPAEIAAIYSCTGRPTAFGTGSIRLGDLYAEEERGLIVELKVPTSAIGAHYVLSVRCSFKDPSSQELIYGKEQALLVPRPHAVRSSAPNIERLRNFFVTTRAVAESRRLTERSDFTGAHHLLSSARALLLQSSSPSADDYLRELEAELVEVHRRRQRRVQIQRTRATERGISGDEKAEPLTPTSAWRAAERLAKVAIMRKSLNRVSDLHGFENARF